MNASICFIPGICSDDGRALTGWWQVYTRRGDFGFWDERGAHDSEAEARAWCENHGATVQSVGVR